MARESSPAMPALDSGARSLMSMSMDFTSWGWDGWLAKAAWCSRFDTSEQQPGGTNFGQRVTRGHVQAGLVFKRCDEWSGRDLQPIVRRHSRSWRNALRAIAPYVINAGLGLRMSNDARRSIAHCIDVQSMEG